MNTTPTEVRITFSNLLTVVNTPPIRETANANKYVKTITGSPVPMANTTGKYNPDVLEMVIGIRTPK